MSIKPFRKYVEEDAAANAAGNGGVAGIGVGPKGEPGVNLKKKKKGVIEGGPITIDMLRRMVKEGAEEMIAQRMKALKADGKEDTKEYKYLATQLEEVTLDDETVEAAAAEVHNQWMDKQKELGHDSHKSPDGDEEYMKPYHELSDDAKDLDRGAVTAVLDALNDVTEEVKPTDTFAGAAVFEVDMDKIHAARFGKNRYHRYSRYVGTDEIGEGIRQHGRNTKDDIVLKDSKTNVMTYLRRKKK